MAEIPYGYCHCGCGERPNIASRTNPTMGHVKGEPYRFVRGHARWKTGPEWVEQDDGCWIWQRAVNRHSGNYGFKGFLRDGRLTTTPAHRYVYELLRGPIPAGHDLHHKCRVRLCVNPDHMEPIEWRTHRGAHNKERALANASGTQ